MKLTKHEHACLEIAVDGSTLVIDPGSFTSPIEATDVVAVVITHEHADHWTPEHLTRLRDANPGVAIYAPAGVVAAASGIEIETVADGDTVSAGPFTLRFFGSKHAEIHRSIPIVDNVGVLVNDTLYSPGDSYTVPAGVAVDVLATPAGAPWLKIGEVIDFVDAVAPRRSFPAHEMTLSDAGKSMSNARIAAATEHHGGEFFPLTPGDSLEL